MDETLKEKAKQVTEYCDDCMYHGKKEVATEFCIKCEVYLCVTHYNNDHLNHAE